MQKQIIEEEQEQEREQKLNIDLRDDSDTFIIKP